MESNSNGQRGNVGSAHKGNPDQIIPGLIDTGCVGAILLGFDYYNYNSNYLAFTITCFG